MQNKKSGLIPAEQVFNKLFSEEIVKPFLWKKTAPDTQYYNVQIECNAKRDFIHSFQVLVDNGEHFIFESAYNIFAEQLKSHNK